LKVKIRAKNSTDDDHIIEDAKRIRECARAVSFDFVVQELELGLTFCRIAQTNYSKYHAQRHGADADKAYRTALRFADTLDLNTEERVVFDGKERELRRMLEELGIKSRQS
jgi:hypothetical protein